MHAFVLELKQARLFHPPAGTQQRQKYYSSPVNRQPATAVGLSCRLVHRLCGWLQLYI